MSTVDSTRLIVGLERFRDRVMAEALPGTVRRMRQDPRVPRGQSGGLVQSIGTDGRVRSSGTAATGRVVADSVQAVTTEKGTRPHVIRPRRRGGVLVFPSRGRLVFARHVNHPGNAPAPWWQQVVTDAFREALGEAGRAAGGR